MTPSGDTSEVRLDGFHALKHAIRFGANILRAHTERCEETLTLARQLAPDIEPWLDAHLETVAPGFLASLSSEVHPTRVVAFARRPVVDLASFKSITSPCVLLEDPRHLGNVGASIRVSAALGASGVITTGTIDPWRPDALRGSAGLHFALPVVGPIDTDAVTSLSNPLVALDPDGDDIASVSIAPNSVLCFGTERDGVSDILLERCASKVRLPMRRGVSSMNLATSVSATLFYLSSGPLRASFDVDRW